MVGVVYCMLTEQDCTSAGNCSFVQSYDFGTRGFFAENFVVVKEKEK